MQIQKFRLKHGWSQEQLADLTGLSVRTIQRIERGQPASTESMKALGAVFNVNFLDLAQQKDNDMPQAVPESAPVDLARVEEALAFAHVRKLKGFYIHAMQYAVVIPGLAIINLVTSPEYLWFIWPMLGWGFGLAMHGLQVFNRFPFLRADWERRAVEKKLGRKL